MPFNPQTRERVPDDVRQATSFQIDCLDGFDPVVTSWARRVRIDPRKTSGWADLRALHLQAEAARLGHQAKLVWGATGLFLVGLIVGVILGRL